MNMLRIAEKNITLLSQSAKSTNDFEQLYIQVRKKENRLYTDEEVALLPAVKKSNIHYKEWLIRQRSCNRLLTYLKRKNKPLKILEVGCGNGWLSSKLAEVKNSSVIGLDINLTEIKQAEEVFNKPNLLFLYAAIENNQLPKDIFDVIVFAASIQYFSDFKKVIESALPLLNFSGEIHILDTNFYNVKNVEAAKARTAAYYNAIGFSSMSKYYFHHLWQHVRPFSHTVLNNPGYFINNILKNKIFPWIKIYKN